MRAKEKFTKKLLVEGNDDQHVIWALCQKFGIPKNFEVIDCKGVDNLFAQIPLRLKESEISSIGIIVDADIEIKQRWGSLSALLSKLGFIVPLELPQTGLVIENQGIKIGIWIMPNNNLNGMLEDFITFLIPTRDELAEFAKKTLMSIEQQNLHKYQLLHKSKAFIHSWLAWQETPGTPMGLAITKRYLTTDEKTCQQLVDWVIKTFN